MKSAAILEKEIASWNVVRRAALREMLAGNCKGRRLDLAHKEACTKISDLTLKLKRAKKRSK